MDLRSHIEQARASGISDEDLQEALRKKGYSAREINSLLVTQRDAGTPVTSHLSMWSKVRLLLFSPRAFYAQVQDTSIFPALLLLFISSLVVAVITSFVYSIVYSALGSSLFSSELGSLAFFLGRGMLGAQVAFTLICSFVFAGGIHILVLLTRGKGTFVDTYSAFAYALVPGVLFSIVPVVGILGYIYSLVLASIGIARYHSFSGGKALMVTLAPFLIPLAFVTILGLYLYGLYG